MHFFYAATYDGTLDGYSVNASNKIEHHTRTELSRGAAASWLVYNAHARLLYSVDERNPGRIDTHRVQDHGTLQPRNTSVWSGGDGPVSLALSQGALFVANYASGTAAALRFTADGLPMQPEAHDIVQFTREGTGPIAARQDHAYAHQIVHVPGVDSLYVPDLGSDVVHRLQLSNKGLTRIDGTAVAPGSGPRHIAFHGANAYLVSELSNTVSTFRVDPRSGALMRVGESISTLKHDPPHAAGTESPYSTAEVAIDPTGRFVYASTRGDAREDAIAIFARDAHEEGALTFVKHVPCGGRNPRHFSLSTDTKGRYIVVGNQQDATIALFVRNADTGDLHVCDVFHNAGKVAYAGFTAIAPRKV